MNTLVIIAAALALPFESTTLEVEKGNQIAEFAAKELNAIVSRAAGSAFEVEKRGGGGQRRAHSIFIRRDDSYADEESAVYEKDGNLYLVGGGQQSGSSRGYVESFPKRRSKNFPQWRCPFWYNIRRREEKNQ